MNGDGNRLDLPGALRALRRRADLSQRELADRSGVPRATVASVESGASANPTLHTVGRLVKATGARLAIVDADGSEPARLATDSWSDEAGRRFPPHLDPYRVTWRGIGPVNGFGFIRTRSYRNAVRRNRAGERREDLLFEVRRLGPGDTDVLRALRTNARDLDLAGRNAPDEPPLSDDQALRYLRDPSLRHWIAEQRVSGRVIGQLVVRVHRPYAGHAAMIVVGVGIRSEHRDGLAGIMLTAAMSDAAALLGVEEIVAIADEPAVANYLRQLGFRRPGRGRPPLLVLPW